MCHICSVQLQSHFTQKHQLEGYHHNGITVEPVISNSRQPYTRLKIALWLVGACRSASGDQSQAPPQFHCNDMHLVDATKLFWNNIFQFSCTISIIRLVANTIYILTFQQNYTCIFMCMFLFFHYTLYWKQYNNSFTF